MAHEHDSETKHAHRHQWFQNHQKPEQIEAYEVARLNTTIEAQAVEIRELKEEIKRLGFNETIHPAPQSPDEHPEEKKSWWQRVNDWNDR